MDIVDIILEQHNEQRRLFGFIEEMRAGNSDALNAVWKRLQGLLDSHAEGEERFFYPELLKQGSGAGDAKSAEDETRDAIEDHNKIRDTGKAVDEHQTGTDDWFDAVAKCDLENSKHMSEEERQGLADFRANAPVEERHRLGVEFLAYVSRHLTGVKPVDKDPDKYIKKHEGATETA